MFLKYIYKSFTLLLLILWFLNASCNKKTILEKENTIKIGVLGTMSGPAAFWGLVNKYCAETTAEVYNQSGGIEIEGEKYRIEIISFDDKMDPLLAVKGAEKLVKLGVKYIIGPNVDATSRSVIPVLESSGVINISYAFPLDLYSPPRENTILGMIAGYQAIPLMLKYFKKEKKIRSVAFFSRNDSESIYSRNIGMKIANELGIEVVSISKFDISEEQYNPNLKNHKVILKEYITKKPDLLMLSGATPGDGPLLVNEARSLGYKGYIATETAQDLNMLSEVTGNKAEGMTLLAGASNPDIQSEYMKRFISLYENKVGSWHDEAGTKVYALEIILATLQKAGKLAIHNTSFFKKELNTFEIQDPLVSQIRILRYTGENDFKQKRQIGIPLIIGEFRKGKIIPLQITTVD